MTTFQGDEEDTANRASGFFNRDFAASLALAYDSSHRVT